MCYDVCIGTLLCVCQAQDKKKTHLVTLNFKRQIPSNLELQ
uniref:Uncharacterized protein n=1 Tax=Rhizophora mucronata TaxID=61149 RepID=A0A2P2QQH0_RHIMU